MLRGYDHDDPSLLQLLHVVVQQQQQPQSTHRFLQDDTTTMINTTFVDPVLSNDDNDSSSNQSSLSKNFLSVLLSNVFLFCLIFGLSATVNVAELKHQLTNRFALGCGIVMQFCLLPLLGLLAVLMFDVPRSMGIALLVVTSSPGGSYSNWWCSLFNAELALSVAMTTVSSILSIVLLPANLMLYSYLAFGHDDEQSIVQALDFGTLFITLSIVLIAICTGLYAGYLFPHYHSAANKLGSISGLLLIGMSMVLGGGGGGSDVTVWSLPWNFYIATAFPCIAGMVLANLLSRCAGLRPPETVALAIECCYQNTGIATSVAITLFDDPDEQARAVSVPLVYGILEALLIGSYCVAAWKANWTKAPASDPLCKVLTNTYERQEENGIEETTDEELGGERPPDPGNGMEIVLEEEEEEGRQRERRPWYEEWMMLFWRRPPSENRTDDDDNNGKSLTATSTPTKKADPRLRIVSADYTAETQISNGSPVTTPRVSTIVEEDNDDDDEDQLFSARQEDDSSYQTVQG